MRVSSIALAPVVASAFALGACTAGPDYAGPPAVQSLPAGAGFVRGGDAVSQASPALAEWWGVFGDATLNALQSQALANSPNLAAVQAKIRQARSSIALERANRLPQLSASGLYGHAQIPGLNLGGGEEGGEGAGEGSGDGGSSAINVYNLGVNASWELDFAGGQRRSQEGALAQAGQAEAHLADAEVQLTAEVAQAYVNLRERQARLGFLRQRQAHYQNMLLLAEQRLARGTVSALTVEQARSRLDGLTPDIVTAEVEQEIYLNGLAVLTGKAPGALDAQLAVAASVPLPPEQVTVGDAGALIQRRPDIRAAERAIAAATAKIGMADAARYPRISFMGILGLGATSPGDLLDLDNISAIALPHIQWSFLDFGRNRARLSQAEAARDEAEARYQQAVLSALQDVENALTRFGRQRETLAALARIKTSAQRSAQLNGQRYNAGVITLADKLETDTQLVIANQNLTSAGAALTGSYIAVQKALGLGWADPAT